MKRITNESGVFEIDDEGVLQSFAFSGGVFKDVNIPEGVLIIPEGIFKGRNIRTLKIPASLKEIREFAFAEARINTVDFESGAGWIKIDESAFLVAYIGNIKFSEINKNSRAFDKALKYSFGFYSFNNENHINYLLENADMIQNESGIFFVDSIGLLVAYKLFFKEKRSMNNLIIPEGVRIIGSDSLRYITVLGELKLPSTLELIGTGSGCVFSHGNFNEIIIPEKLRLGRFTFGSSTIGSLTLSNGFEPSLRQFKDCRIKTLNLRVENPDKTPECFLDAKIDEIKIT